MSELAESPYRESDGPAVEERPCPKCGARVSYAAGAASATCAACDTQFAIAVDHLSDGAREPRAIQRTPDSAPSEALVKPKRYELPPRVPIFVHIGTFVGLAAFICSGPLIGVAAAAALGGFLGLGAGASSWKYRRDVANKGDDR
jgi:hypothetical protein